MFLLTSSIWTHLPCLLYEPHRLGQRSFGTPTTDLRILALGHPYLIHMIRDRAAALHQMFVDKNTPECPELRAITSPLEFTGPSAGGDHLNQNKRDSAEPRLQDACSFTTSLAATGGTRIFTACPQPQLT